MRKIAPLVDSKDQKKSGAGMSQLRIDVQSLAAARRVVNGGRHPSLVRTLAGAAAASAALSLGSPSPVGVVPTRSSSERRRTKLRSKGLLLFPAACPFPPSFLLHTRLSLRRDVYRCAKDSLLTFSSRSFTTGGVSTKVRREPSPTPTPTPRHIPSSVFGE